MKHVDLTSGIGGFALAARWVGWETVGFCEIDEWCRRVLARNFPGVPQHDDLKSLTTEHVRGWLVGVQPCLDSDEQGEPVGTSHDAPQSAKLGPYVLTAGYPCQPFSHAGKRAGEDDPRHLWPWIHRLLAGLSDDKPDWVVFENVRGHVSMGLDGVLDDLEGLGYATRTFVVPAAGVGALHRRERVWIVGCHDPVADSSSSRVSRIRKGDGHPRLGFASGNARRSRGGTIGIMADQWTNHRDSRSEAEPGFRGAADGLSLWVDGPLGAFGRGWEYGVPLTVSGPVPDRVNRLKALGNAVVPQIPYLIFMAIEEACRASDG